MKHGILSAVIRSWLAGMLALVMVFPALAGGPDVTKSTMERTQTQQTLTGAGAPKLNRRAYALDNGDSVLMGRLETEKKGDAATAVEQYSVPSATCVIRYYDTKTSQWIKSNLKQGRYDAGMIQLSFAGDDFFLYLPKTYLRLSNGGLQYRPWQDGYLQTKQTNQGWEITLYAKAPEGGLNADYVVVRSDKPLLDWNHKYTADLWKNYTMAGDGGKWCYDGYYWPAPSTYQPSGENVYFRCAASYLVKSFAYAGEVHRAAADLARCTLDTLTLRQTPDGCWLTPSRSTWLAGDYGIGAGFYDTRFNTELVQIMAYAYPRYGGDSVYQSMNAYADFFVKFATEHHTATPGGGWLVEDYWSPYGSRKSHTSLNHMLAECDLLYRLTDVLQRPELATLADKLLLGVRETGKKWIRPDGNLHYAIYPNGSYGGADYPELTYNDMFILRKLLKELGRPDEPVLAQLMASKKIWMDQNKVTSYLK